MTIPPKSDTVRRTRRQAVAVFVLAATLALVVPVPAAAPAVADDSSAMHPIVAVPQDMWNQRRVLNVAHAGGDLEAPHSTLFAMKEAVKNGTDVLEMDVRFSADGVLMVHHDDTVDRTTNNTGNVSNFTAAELQAMDNGYWFYPDCWSCHSQPAGDYVYRGIRTGSVPAPTGYTANDFGIATLAEVAEAFPGRTLDVEIKAAPNAYEVAAELATFIAANGPVDRYLVASFDDALTDYFKTLAPSVSTSPGQSTMIDWFVNRGPMPAHRVLQVPPTFGGITVVTQQFVDDAHANGLAVWVWFNGNEEENPAMWQSLIDMGVDALLNSKPRQAEAVIEANSAVFRSTPTIATHGSASAGSAKVGYTCDPAHVALCESLVVVVAKNAGGRYEIVGTGWVSAHRGSTATANLTLTRFGRRELRNGPLQGIAVAWRANSDTEHDVAAIGLSIP